MIPIFRDKALVRAAPGASSPKGTGNGGSSASEEASAVSATAPCVGVEWLVLTRRVAAWAAELEPIVSIMIAVPLKKVNGSKKGTGCVIRYPIIERRRGRIRASIDNKGFVAQVLSRELALPMR